MLKILEIYKYRKHKKRTTCVNRWSLQRRINENWFISKVKYEQYAPFKMARTKRDRNYSNVCNYTYTQINISYKTKITYVNITNQNKHYKYITYC